MISQERKILQNKVKLRNTLNSSVRAVGAPVTLPGPSRSLTVLAAPGFSAQLSVQCWQDLRAPLVITIWQYGWKAIKVVIPCVQ